MTSVGRILLVPVFCFYSHIRSKAPPSGETLSVIGCIYQDQSVWWNSDRKESTILDQGVAKWRTRDIKIKLEATLCTHCIAMFSCTLCSDVTVNVQVRIVFTRYIPFISYHYMFRANWPSSSIQVVVKISAALLQYSVFLRNRFGLSLVLCVIILLPSTCPVYGLVSILIFLWFLMWLSRMFTLELQQNRGHEIVLLQVRKLKMEFLDLFPLSGSVSPVIRR